MKMKELISWNDFEKIDIRTGTIVKVEKFPEAKKEAYKLKIDFGEFGIKNSSAQITNLYTQEALLNKQVVAIVNFPVMQIANFFSECLVLGVYSEDGDVVLLQPDKKIDDGMKVG